MRVNEKGVQPITEQQSPVTGIWRGCVSGVRSVVILSLSKSKVPNVSQACLRITKVPKKHKSKSLLKGCIRLTKLDKSLHGEAMQLADDWGP